jgi:hypothetical protein
LILLFLNYVQLWLITFEIEIVIEQDTRNLEEDEGENFHNFDDGTKWHNNDNDRNPSKYIILTKVVLKNFKLKFPNLDTNPK